MAKNCTEKSRVCGNTCIRKSYRCRFDTDKTQDKGLGLLSNTAKALPRRRAISVIPRMANDGDVSDNINIDTGDNMEAQIAQQEEKIKEINNDIHFLKQRIDGFAYSKRVGPNSHVATKAKLQLKALKEKLSQEKKALAELKKQNKVKK